MSVLIRGVEMPTSCRACHLKINCDDCEGRKCVCAPLHKEIGYLDDLLADKRRDDCPLVPVPPHGRLIDADALLDDLLFPSKQFEQGMRELIGDAPTVVPAEEAPAKDTNVPTGPYDLLYEEGGANTT